MKKTMQSKQKKTVKLVIISVVAVLLVIFTVVGVNVQNKHQRINYLVTRLGEVSSLSAVEGDTEREALVRKYAEDAYFKKTILSNLTSYQNIEPTEEGYRWDGLVNTVSLVSNLKVLGYSDSDMDNTLERFALDELTVYMEKNDFEAFAETISLLDKHKIENENIKTLFQTYLHDVQEELFEGNGTVDMYDYIKNVNNQLDGSNYTTILECYPYDKMIAYINQRGQLVIAEDGCGGYYDDLKNEYINESYWVDPLLNTRSSKGEVGTYQHTESNELFGDFRVCIVSKYWYQTAKNDSNNSLRASLYYQGNQIMSDYEEITVFLRKITSKNCYHVLSENGKHIFFVLGKDQITVLGNKLFTIAYE